MTTFTIDNDNNITAFPTADQSEAAVGAGAQPFTSQKQLAELASAWPAERLVAIWNSLPGVKPVESFKSPKAAASRIWARIQGLGEAAQPEAEPAKPKARKKAKGGAQAAKGAPAKAKASKKTTPAKKAPKAKKAAKAPKAAKPKPEGPREGSKMAQVIAMMERKNGATLAEIMSATGWLSHTTRAFVSATLGKKLGLAIESFKPEGGERTYKINK